ncbi:hypothetical protein B6D19_00370 [Gilliamella apicola]|nr:hypothetical protein B6D19_00370 [Gilliamella apicola]OTQ45871.1 hypothetical protein B6D20_03370 [Gilliamella apicola]
MTEIWLAGDHYKWRVLRAVGIDEKFITRDASNYEKYLTWAKAVPFTFGNSIYHWMLKTFFLMKKQLIKFGKRLMLN